MLISTCLMETIADWFSRILMEYKITPAEIKRRTGLSEGHMSKVLKGERGLGEDVVRKIAKAVNVPPEIFFRQVGLLPPIPVRTEQHQQLTYLFDQMDTEKRADLLFYAEVLLKRPKASS